MKILRYFNYREFPDGNHRIREELRSYGSAGDEIKNREAPDKNGRVGMSASLSFSKKNAQETNDFFGSNC